VIANFLRRLGFGGRSKDDAGGQGARGGKPASSAKGKSRSTAGKKSASRGNESADRELLLEAMREASPDFDRFCRVTQDEDAVETALRTLYAALPPSGRGGRTAVVRRYLLKKAREDGDDADVADLERLSEKQLALVARRGRIPI
jgi:hypothetical protein